MKNKHQSKQSTIERLEQQLSQLAIQAETIREELSRIKSEDSEDSASVTRQVVGNNYNRPQFPEQQIIESRDRQENRIELGDRVKILTAGKFKATTGTICNISSKGYVTIQPKRGAKIVRRSHNVQITAKSST